MFDSLVEALEHNLAQARAEGYAEGYAEGRILERLDAARSFFNEDVTARMHTLLHRLPPEQMACLQRHVQLVRVRG